MVSYAELCQAIERWQRSQGRVTALESALQQAMWRGFIRHHAPEVQMDFPEDLSAPQEPEHGDAALLHADPGYAIESLDDEEPYAATGS